MAQQLQVYKNPSIVQNAPTTDLERLQNRLDEIAPTYTMTRSPIAEMYGRAPMWTYGAANAHDVVKSVPQRSALLDPPASAIDASNPLDLSRLGLSSSASRAIDTFMPTGGPGVFPTMAFFGMPGAREERPVSEPPVSEPPVSEPPKGISSLFAPTPRQRPTVGANGRRTITSGELAGANRNFGGGTGAVLPSSMNTSRWTTGY